jgi:hypothetical protein
MQLSVGTQLVRVAVMLYVLWLLSGLLLLIWIVGVAGALALGNGIHVLLAVAICAIAVTLFARPHVI